MAWNFSPNKPVFIQIGEKIKLSVISGKYPPGAQVPTVRQLALEAAVNPNTVQRAFSVLETEGIIISKGTAGKFVTEDISVIEECRKRMAQKIIDTFVLDMNNLGISTENAIYLLELEKGKEKL